MLQPSRRILWAVDVDADQPDLQRQMTAALAVWTAQGAGTVEPVYVMAPEFLKMPARYFAEHLEPLKASVAERLTGQLKDWGMHSGAPVKLLVSERASTRQACAALLAYAKSSGADLVALTTHGRSGVSRLLLGSFAETLIQMAEIPLFLVTPNSRPLVAVAEVLLPTDLSPAWARAFPRVVAFARTFGAKIRLVHVSQFLATHADATYGPVEAYQAHLQADLAEREAILKGFVAQAQRLGVEASATLVREETSPAAAILQIAATIDSGMIAMVSKKTGIEASLLGSVTRKIVRQAPLPVWVMHAP